MNKLPFLLITILFAALSFSACSTVSSEKNPDERIVRIVSKNTNLSSTVIDRNIELDGKLGRAGIIYLIEEPLKYLHYIDTDLGFVLTLCYQETTIVNGIEVNWYGDCPPPPPA